MYMYTSQVHHVAIQEKRIRIPHTLTPLSHQYHTICIVPSWCVCVGGGGGGGGGADGIYKTTASTPQSFTAANGRGTALLFALTSFVKTPARFLFAYTSLVPLSLPCRRKREELGLLPLGALFAAFSPRQLDAK